MSGSYRVYRQGPFLRVCCPWLKLAFWVPEKQFLVLHEERFVENIKSFLLVSVINRTKPGSHWYDPL